jgi:hypothetical protein
MPSIKILETPKRPRRRNTPIEPIHVEELLAGAGMSGFLGVLNAPVLATHQEKRPDSSEISTRVASVVLKVEALTQLIGGENPK